MKTYRIEHIRDLLQVPLERRAACLSEIEYGIALFEFAQGESMNPETFGPIEWTDDGERTSRLIAPNGEAILTLKVTEDGHAAP